jgi:hypothetical protein
MVAALWRPRGLRELDMRYWRNRVEAEFTPLG